MTGKMKLSEAMLAGRNALPHAEVEEGLIADIRGGEIKGCCAEGFALVGVCGVEKVLELRASDAEGNNNPLYRALKDEYPELETTVTIHGSARPLEEHIWYFNDTAKLDIPEIAAEIAAVGY